MCGLLSVGRRVHVELLFSVTTKAACWPHYRLPRSHTNHLGRNPAPRHLPPPTLQPCKQSAKYFITSLRNRAKTHHRAPVQHFPCVHTSVQLHPDGFAVRYCFLSCLLLPLFFGCAVKCPPSLGHIDFS